ncbi:MAG: hypothetical protein M1814_000276 [Vezdaea aestivalis]|nr:MAG: hypothetical protein M1814_000276 [Vezdaea aestivalis]
MEQIRTRPPFLAQGPGLIPPVEALWKKKFSIHQERISADLNTLKALVTEISAKQSKAESNLQEQEQISAIWADISALKTQTHRSDRADAETKALTSRLDHLLRNIGSTLDPVINRVNFLESEGTDLRDQIARLEARLEQVHSAHLYEVDGLKKQLHTLNHGSYQRFWTDFLQLEDARQKIRQDAATKIEQLNDRWRVESSTTWQAHLERQGTHTSNISAVSIPDRSAKAISDLDQHCRSSTAGLEPPRNLQPHPNHAFRNEFASRQTAKLQPTFDQSKTSPTGPSRPHSRRSNGSSTDRTLTGQEFIPRTGNLRRNNSPSKTSRILEINGHFQNTDAVNSPSNALNSPNCQLYREQSIPVAPFARPVPIFRHPALQPPQTPITPVPTKRPLSTHTRASSHNLSTAKRARTNTTAPHTSPITTAQLPLRTPGRIANRKPSIAPIATVALPRNNNAQPPLSTNPSMTLSELQNMAAQSRAGTTTTQVGPFETASAARKPRRKVDNTPRPWNPNRPRTREQLKRQVTEHPELPGPNFIQL